MEEERRKEEEERRRKLEEERRRKEEEERRKKLEEERRKEEEKLEQEKIKCEKKENNKQLGLKLNLSSNQIKNIVDKNEEIKKDEVQERKEKKKIEEIETEEVVDLSSVIEEYNPARDGEIYDDMANLMEYYKKVSPELDAKTKEKVQQLIGDLVGFVKNDSFREARGKENEILKLIYRG